MSSEALFYSKGLCIDGGSVLQDISVLSGDVVWFASENPLAFELFTAFILGLIKVRKGRVNVCGKDINAIPHNVISYFDIVNWYPELGSIDSLVNVLVYSRGLQPSFVLNEFKRILSGIGGAYALNLSLNEMTHTTKIMVSTALVMSMPSLIMLLHNPFEYLDKEGKVFLDTEIRNVSNDGSSVFILSDAEPAFYNKSMEMVLK